ncbi:putative aconitase subunit 1 [Bosea sp. AK1]|uniref:cis-3-hydroxy-L-proline dehydratase n=1 Tax=Bosea sp. AK1 TaxID=2587160 RepID=UPI00115059F6|nr:aconitase X [Bosea sp. AK1]TQI65310.1 putative aconitase subunit 1 [Bosea sp. AK1]
MKNAVAETSYSGIAYVQGEASGEVIASGLELSFWGGVDPGSGEVIDRHHPLSGRILGGKILAIPGGRGSCSGSGVILELLLNGKGPKGMIVERKDDIMTLGVVIAEEVFGVSIPVVTLDPSDFRNVLSSGYVEIKGNQVRCDARAPGKDRRDDAGINHGGFPVELSEVDRQFLDGSYGKAAQAAIKIILRMAQLQGARQLMDVSQVHIDGCIYTGPGSLAFARQLRDWGAKVAVPATLNSISVDYRRWRAHGLDPAFGVPASQLGDAYTDMGARPTFTCAPYLLDTAPSRGEQIAWAESNAVVYANSVLGARTMKYPDFLDICIALTGRAPLAGCHVDMNRLAKLRVNIHEVGRVDDAFYPLLGYHVGMLAANLIPVIVGLEDAAPTHDDLKAFGAAFATVSSAPMFHIVGVTPEANTLESAIGQGTDVTSIDLKLSDLIESWNALNSAHEEKVDLVSLGNPHFSATEFGKLAELCRGKTKHRDVSIIVTSGRAVLEQPNVAGFKVDLEAFGIQFITDTCWCMITEPLIPATATSIMTNSGKYAHYGPGLTGRRFHFGSLSDCVEAAETGFRRGERPEWLRAD